LEGSVVVILISHPLLALHALLMAPSLLLDRDGASDDVAKGLMVACLKSMTKAVLKAL
jgi:hypothetical protein